MAIPEACGLWIEQRVQEELERKGETGSSLREIGRQVAAEVEKYFETTVNPETIRKKVERINGTNVPQQENEIKPDGNGGNNGNTTTTIKAVQEIEKEVKKGVTVREAAKKIAEKTGKNEGSLRVAHQRNQAKKQPKLDSTTKNESKPSKTSFAMDFATMAISQLGRITKNDPMRIQALNRVKGWITQQLETS